MCHVVSLRIFFVMRRKVRRLKVPGSWPSVPFRIASARQMRILPSATLLFENLKHKYQATAQMHHSLRYELCAVRFFTMFFFPFLKLFSNSVLNTDSSKVSQFENSCPESHLPKQMITFPVKERVTSIML